MIIKWKWMFISIFSCLKWLSWSSLLGISWDWNQKEVQEGNIRSPESQHEKAKKTIIYFHVYAGEDSPWGISFPPKDTSEGLVIKSQTSLNSSYRDFP